MNERRGAAKRIFTVAGMDVRVTSYVRNDAVFDHDYEYLNGPHTGLTWSIFTSFQPGVRDHHAWIQEHLEESAPSVTTTAEEMTM